MNQHPVLDRIGSLADLAAQAPRLHQLISRSGAQRRRRREAHVARRAGWLGVGLALGAGLTTLLTPRTGAEMRQQLSARARRVRDYVAPKGNGAADQGQP
jgi:hypothetical protein